MAATKDEGYMTFEQWATAYNKKYDSQTVKDERKNVWEQNLDFVKHHNAGYLAGKHSYRIQQTRCSDQTLEELSWMSSAPTIPAGAVVSNPGDPHGPAEPLLEPNPERVDWRERGCVSPVRDQDPLPACWIFAAVSAVESHNAITNGDLVELSVQQLVDCIDGGNEKGYVERALDYIAYHGSIRESEYPQSFHFEMGPKCMSAGKKVAVELDRTRYVYVGKSEEELETAVARIGPVAVTLTFFNKAQQKKFEMVNFRDIFYDPQPGGKKDEIGRSVLLIGYGLQQSMDKNGVEKYWIIKKSWSHNSNDKDSGFKKIAKDRGNQCRIASYAIYPVVKKHLTTR